MNATESQKTVAKFERMAELWTKKAEIARTLVELDRELGLIEEDQEIAKANGNGQHKRRGRPKGKKAAQAEEQKPRRRGRPVGSKNKKKDNPQQVVEEPEVAQAEEKNPGERTESGKRFRNQESLKGLIVSVLGKAKGDDGMKLDELVQACYETGYRSTSDRKGFIQNVRTNLNTLMNKGVVHKDKEKRYTAKA